MPASINFRVAKTFFLINIIVSVVFPRRYLEPVLFFLSSGERGISSVDTIFRSNIGQITSDFIVS